MIASLFPTASFALTWKEAETLALAHNFGLEAREEAISVAEYDVRNARSYHYPELEILGTARKFDDQNGPAHRLNIGPRLTLPIFQGGRVVEATAVAKERKIQADAEFRTSKVRLLRDLRHAFSDALYVKRLIDLSKQIVDQRKESMEFVKLRYESGMEFRWVYLASLEKLERAKLGLLDAQLEEGVVLSRLHALLGVSSVDSVSQINGDDFFQSPKDYELSELLGHTEAHPDMIESVSKEREALRTIGFRKGFFYPEIGFVGDLQVADTEDVSPFPFWAVSLVANLPLFEGGRNYRNLRIARLQRNLAEASSKQIRLNIESRIKSAFKEVEIQKQRVEVAKSSYNASLDRSRVVTDRYRSGLEGYLDFERAQDDWVGAEQEVLRVDRDLQKARAQLESEIGMELGS